LARELATSIRRANLMFQQLALGGAASGSENANSVYLDIIKQIGATSRIAKSDGTNQKQQISEFISDLGERSGKFERLGLTPRFVSFEFAKAIRDVDDSNAEIATRILNPYLNSLGARLDALEDARTRISTFLTEANSFLEGKALTYTPKTGIVIASSSGERLFPHQLSSGECHLVLLLCNALLARDGSRLFLIDEPELSLNVKWQRRIIGALLACTEGSDVQFIIATHSIELLSPHRDNVVRMTGKSAVKEEDA